MNRSPAATTDLRVVPLARSAASLCDCGQPAAWTVWLPTGKSARPTPFDLCDHCLALELNNPPDHNTGG